MTRIQSWQKGQISRSKFKFKIDFDQYFPEFKRRIAISMICIIFSSAKMNAFENLLYSYGGYNLL